MVLLVLAKRNLLLIVQRIGQTLCVFISRCFGIPFSLFLQANRKCATHCMAKPFSLYTCEKWEMSSESFYKPNLWWHGSRGTSSDEWHHHGKCMQNLCRCADLASKMRLSQWSGEFKSKLFMMGIGTFQPGQQSSPDCSPDPPPEFHRQTRKAVLLSSSASESFYVIIENIHFRLHKPSNVGGHFRRRSCHATRKPRKRPDT